MAEWDHVELFGNALDETVNFGPRLESGSALYQVDTLAVISASEKVEKNPQVRAASVGSQLAVATGSLVSSFSEDGFNLSGTLSFDSLVDALTWSPDEKFLVIGERKGVIHFINASTCTTLFSQTLVQSQSKEDQTFMSVSFRGKCELVILTRRQLFTISNIDISVFSNDAPINAKEVQKKIKLCVANVCSEHTDGATCFAHLGTFDNALLTSGYGMSNLTMWLPHAGGLKPLRRWQEPSNKGIDKVVVLKKGRFFLTLNEMGTLCLWCYPLCCKMKEWPRKVTDFTILEEGSTSRTSGISDVKLAVLTRPDSNDGLVSLEICSLGDMEPEYSLKLDPFTHLVHAPPQQEYIAFLEGVVETNSSDRIMSNLRLRSLTEVQAETRLNRMLRKKQFDKAEALAKQFNLNVQLVYEVKAREMLEHLSPWSVEKFTESEVEQLVIDLRRCLDLIQEESVIMECCVKATPIRIEMVRELLTYAKLRLCSSTEASSSPLLTQVNEVLHRLATFQLVYGPDQFTPSHWDSFMSVNLLDELRHHLVQGAVSRASTVLRRHLVEFNRLMSKTVVYDLLHAIHEGVSSRELCAFLGQDFLPLACRKLPGALAIIAKWLEEKALSFEQNEPSGWPTNALAVAQLIDQYMSQDDSVSAHTLITPAETCLGEEHDRDALDALQTLILELTDLVSLHKKYNCYITLDKYRKQTSESLAFCLLDKVLSVNLLKMVVTDVVRPYLREHNLPEDRTLLHYVKALSSRPGPAGGTPWEDKAIVVISCLTEPEYRLKATLCVVKRARLPWSDAVNSLVEEMLRLEHRLVAELREEQCRAEVRKIFIKYSLPTRVLDVRVAMKLVHFIIRQDQTTGLADALTVVTNFKSAVLSDVSVYKIQLDFFVECNRVQEAMKLVKSLPAEKAIQIGHQFITSTSVRLNSTVIFDMKSKQKELLQVTHMTCEILRYLLTLEDRTWEEHDHFTRGLDTFDKIHRLQVEYAEFLTLRNYTCNVARVQLLEKRLLSFINDENPTDLPEHLVQIECGCKHTSKNVKKMNVNRMYRFASLLGFNLVEVMGEVAVRSVLSGNLKYAIEVARSLHEHNPGEKSAYYIYRVALELVRMQSSSQFEEALEQVPNLPSVVYELASLALSHCSDDLLLECLELSKGCGLAEGVAMQCEIGDYDTALKLAGTREDPYEDWTFTPYFRDDGLVLESQQALPLAYQYTLSCLQDTRDKVELEEYEDNPECLAVSRSVHQLNKSTVNVVKYLQDNHQLMLAMAYSTNALNLLLTGTLTRPQQDGADQKRETLKALAHRGIQALNVLKDSMIVKMLKGRVCDKPLLLAYLMERPADVLNKLKAAFKAAGYSYKQMETISRVGIDFSILIGDKSMENLLVAMKNYSNLRHKLAKVGCGKEAKSLDQNSAAKAVLSKIVRNKAITIDFLLHFTSICDLDQDEALLLYIENQILQLTDDGSQLPQGSTFTPTDARRIVKAIAKINLRSKLPEKLNAILMKLDPYDYERLQFVLEQIMTMQPTEEVRSWSQLLGELLVYQRVAPPGEYELEYGEQSEAHDLLADRERLSPLAATRLPFHALTAGRAWKIIAPELNVATVKMWIPMVSLLKLKTDQLYLLTVQNIVRQYVDGIKTRRRSDSELSKAAAASGDKTPVKESCTWEVTETVTEMISVLSKLLFSVSSYEMAIACASWTAKELPIGAEKVLALKGCMKLASKWLETSQEEAEREKAAGVMSKFRDSYRRMATEQALVRHQLAEPYLVALVGRPGALVHELYNHRSVLEASLGSLAAGTGAGRLRPDVHAAASAVCSINELNLADLQARLLEQWLTAMSDQQDMNCSVVTQDEDTNLKRLVHVFKCTGLERSIRFLLHYIFKEGSENITTNSRILAMRSLLRLADPSHIQEAFKLTLEQLKEHLVTLIYVRELEHLGISHSASSFVKCNKDGLVRSIWRNHHHRQRAVTLVVHMCLDFDVMDPQLWNKILKQLHSFYMLNMLEGVLVRLTEFPQLSLPCLDSMWMTVLTARLVDVTPPLTPLQEVQCLEAVTLLQRCPVVYELDQERLAGLLARLELPACALSCLLLLPSGEKRSEHIARLLAGVGAMTVLRQVDGWRAAGRHILMADQVEYTVYSEIRGSSKYDELHGTPHAAKLAVQLVRDGDADDLFVYLLKNDCSTQALQLLDLHEQLTPHDKYSQAVAGMPHDTQRFRVFARLRGLEDEVGHLLPEEPEVNDMDSTTATDSGEEEISLSQQSPLTNGFHAL